MADFTAQLEARSGTVRTAFGEAQSLLAAMLGEDAGAGLLAEGGGVKRVLDALCHAACSELEALSNAHEQLSRNGLKLQATTHEIVISQQRTAAKVMLRNKELELEANLGHTRDIRTVDGERR